MWIKPSNGLVKLNFDGAFKGNPGPSAGGGIIRNSDDQMIYAYSSYYGDFTNTLAELLTLHQGICWLHSHDYARAIVKMDSKLIFDCLTTDVKSPRQCWFLIKFILRIHQDLQFTFQHCYREANTVADNLANLGCDLAFDLDFLDTHSLPSYIHGSIILDN